MLLAWLLTLSDSNIATSAFLYSKSFKILFWSSSRLFSVIHVFTVKLVFFYLLTWFKIFPSPAALTIKWNAPLISYQSMEKKFSSVEGRAYQRAHILSLQILPSIHIWIVKIIPPNVSWSSWVTAPRHLYKSNVLERSAIPCAVLSYFCRKLPYSLPSLKSELLNTHTTPRDIGT